MLSNEQASDERGATAARGEGNGADVVLETDPSTDDGDSDGVGEGHVNGDGGDADDSTTRSIAKDDAFHLLQNSRRRAVLRYLLARPGEEQFRMRDLAEDVAAWEYDTTVRQLSSTERQRLYIALYQSHLPKLDDHGLIEYNQSRGVIEPRPLLSVFAPYLESGLHADSQTLTVEDDERENGAGNGNGYAGRLLPGVASLFER